MDSMSSAMRNRLIDEMNRVRSRQNELQNRAEAEDRDWTEEERANWDKANERLDQIEADLARLEKNEKLDNIDYRQVLEAQGVQKPESATEEDRGEKYAEAFMAWTRGGMNALTTEQRAALIEHRASPQNIATPADGGYLVPDGFRAVMTETLKAFGGLINHANVITTATGNSLEWPGNDDTGNVGAILTENTAVSENGLTFTSKSLDAYVYTSNLVLVSLQLLNDSAFNLESFLPRKLGERIGRATAAHFVSGDGSSKPEGVVYNQAAAVTGTGTSAITYDNLIDLEHSVDPAYRASGRCRFLMNDTTLKVLRKLKDSDGRPLWQPVPVAGMPATINGNPYSIDQGMASPGASAKSIAYGDFFAGYVVRMVWDVQMARLAERYAEKLQVGFFGFARLDAVPDDTNAYKVFAHAAS